jgi:CRISPR/Cas system-associated endoribonuclease Cas2
MSVPVIRSAVEPYELVKMSAALVFPHLARWLQNSPFAGVLPEAERRAVLEAFGNRWRSEHAA